MTSGRVGVDMAFVKKSEFAHLSNAHLERLLRMREELERAIDLHHQIDRKQIAPSLKNYWLVSSCEKNILRDGRDRVGEYI